MVLRMGHYEYPCVCRKTRNPRLILEARQTILSEMDAIASAGIACRTL